jgi:hypothetical protein
MLHKDPFLVDPLTIDLIQRLQVMPELDGFYLVGGTALTLQIGHRNSIDIDLFTQQSFDNNALIELIKSKFTFSVKYNFKNTIIGIIEDIKVDFVTHNYPFVKQPITEEGITFLSKEDIVAMKLNAIINSGKRLKDFIDIYFLLEHFSVKEMLDFFTIKYPDYNPLIALKALNYFNDIDLEIDPPKMKKDLKLSVIKKRIENAVVHFNKRY